MSPELHAVPGNGVTSSTWQERLAAPALVAALAAGAFAAGLGGDYVWDDRLFLPPGAWAQVANPLEFFRAGNFAFAQLDVPATVPIYRPLSTVVAWLLAPVLGDRATAWHVLPLVLHAACSVLVYAFARRWSARESQPAALAAGVLFAVLPCHTEAVAYISGWGHPLTTLLALVAVHTQLSQSKSGSPWWLIGAALAVMGAILTCEGAVVLSPLLVGLAWIEGRRRPPAAVWFAYAVAAAAPLWLRGAVLQDPLPLQASVAGIGRAASFGAAYLVDLVSPWPRPPHGSYPRGGVAGVGTWALALALLVGAWLVVARATPPQRPRVLLALAWIALGIAPLAAAGMNATPFYAPRALYLPSVGVALLASMIFARWTSLAPIRHRWLAAAAAIGGLLIGNASALGWRDEITVLHRMLEADPESPLVHVKLASLLEGQGRSEEALRHFEAANRHAVTTADRLLAREVLGVHLGAAGRFEEAARLFSEVLREDPSNVKAWTNMGNVTLAKGDPAGARSFYERALALAPGDGEAAHNLSIALEALGDHYGAAAAKRRAAAVGVGR